MKGLVKAHHPAALDVSNRHARSALILSEGPEIIDGARCWIRWIVYAPLNRRGSCADLSEVGSRYLSLDLERKNMVVHCG
jgi:hypothetical protein